MSWAAKSQPPFLILFIICGMGIFGGCYAHVLSQPTDSAWLEINSGNFESNIRKLREKVLTKNTRICAVMKADAYGHGIELLIPSIIKEKINSVCFTNNQEAKIVREKGFVGNLIRIRSPTAEEIKDVIDLNVEEMAGTLGTVEFISNFAAKNNRTIKVHLSLNSAGMSRDGWDLDTDEGKQGIRKIFELPNIDITGIMTHFPVEDKAGIQTGLEKFLLQANWIMTEGKLNRDKIILHSANTAAAVQVPESHLDMVRVGSLLYGQNSPPELGLKPVMALKSVVASIHRYKKGDTVGYDKTFTLARDSLLANLPIRLRQWI